MPQISPYLSFDGDCAEALRFYERVLGGKIEALMTYGDGPPDMKAHVPAEYHGRVMHGRLDLDGQLIMASDAAGESCGGAYEGQKGVSLALTYPTVSDAERVFAALSEGGHVTMPLQPTFWAEAFGMTVDRHGTSWMVNGAMKA
ncbi:hypothetical protein CEG14_12930 [Bordetella genomosp. 1]|uniref:Glyoxalase/fosfomycin resistance/dioxygenase domain-containing protein n=1 Tax=Bordetella genomosp. 1 TaxID=1395607 RepID=A0A261SG80_9BORD|nr:VOC family protein [Bordetella genomosp. 1]MDQ8034334.1 VOC family protein [Bordetella sp.]OZI35942.1 hypothetical protein CEG14_12930 [Bordetella genomosp. 1]OZI58610.1 hypothetical protein CAL27_18145 [Bordetella genomosp. 1]